MLEQDETSIRITALADVGAGRLFAVLRDPKRHVDIDASGMLQADVGAAPITGVGAVFTMAMHYPSLGDYRTDNHVVHFQPDRAIAWTTARAGQAPAGVVWGWLLDEIGSDRTTVTHSYDWSGVTDPAVLARVSFPRVSAQDLQRSVARLIAAAAAE